MTYDPANLKALGRKRQRLDEQIRELRPELEREIRAAAVAGVPQVEIIQWTGYSREAVRLASMSPEEREVERGKRRKADGAG